MASDIYLCPDGKHRKVDYFNAFFPVKSEKMRILNFGYMQESRILNVHVASYEQKKSIYINLSRNAFIEEEYKTILERVFTGQELQLLRLDDEEESEKPKRQTPRKNIKRRR